VENKVFAEAYQLVRGVPCDLKVTGSSRESVTGNRLDLLQFTFRGCGPSSDPEYAGCFVYRAALFLSTQWPLGMKIIHFKQNIDILY